MGFVCLIIGLVVGVKITSAVREREWQRTIVEHAAAEWRCDPLTGEREFYWLVGDEEKDTQ